MNRAALTLFLAIAASAATARPANLIASAQAPAVTLLVAPSFRPLRPLSFPIADLTQAHRRIYVEAGRGRQLRRMVVVQLERVRPGSSFRFVYPPSPPRRFGAETYRAGAFVYDDAAAAAAAPDREAARTRAALVASGYRLPRLWRVARLARVSDRQGLSEIILFYMENADGDYGSGPLPGADADGDLPLEGAARAALFDRLDRAIRVIRG